MRIFHIRFSSACSKTGETIFYSFSFNLFLLFLILIIVFFMIIINYNIIIIIIIIIIFFIIIILIICSNRFRFCLFASIPAIWILIVPQQQCNAGAFDEDGEDNDDDGDGDHHQRKLIRMPYYQ